MFVGCFSCFTFSDVWVLWRAKENMLWLSSVELLWRSKRELRMLSFSPVLGKEWEKREFGKKSRNVIPQRQDHLEGKGNSWFPQLLLSQEFAWANLNSICANVNYFFLLVLCTHRLCTQGVGVGLYVELCNVLLIWYWDDHGIQQPWVLFFLISWFEKFWGFLNSNLKNRWHEPNVEDTAFSSCCKYIWTHFVI